MASPELAASYAALILADDGVEITVSIRAMTLTSPSLSRSERIGHVANDG